MPSAARSTIRARCARPALTVEDRTHPANRRRSPSRSARAGAGSAGTHHCPAPLSVKPLTPRDTSGRFGTRADRYGISLSSAKAETPTNQRSSASAKCCVLALDEAGGSVSTSDLVAAPPSACVVVQRQQQLHTRWRRLGNFMVVIVRRQGQCQAMRPADLQCPCC